MSRAVVQVGAGSLRVATDDGLLAALPAGGGDSPADAATVLAGLLDGPVDELVVVHPAAGPGTAPLGPATPPALRVRAVPAPVAVLAGRPGDAVVVDVGHRGAEVSRVAGGRVVAVRTVGVGGERLDAVTARLLAGSGVVVGPARVRPVREALSVLPEVRAGTPAVPVAAAALDAALAGPLAALVDVVREVVAAGPGPPPPVLLVGGVARAPLLAELLDAAGVTDVRVAGRPDAAAVLGALDLPPAPSGHIRPAGPAAPTWLPPAGRRRTRRSRVALGVLAAGAALAGLLAAGAAPPPAAPAPVAGELVQYGYAVDLPAGWAHTGGLPERRRSLLTPVGAPDGSDLVSVERSPLGYDAGAEPERARAELRATFAAAVAGGAPLSGFDDAASYAGRPVVAYREAGPAADVDWFVVLDGDAQLSVGCRHTRAGAAGVAAACAAVVRSVRRVG